MSSWVIVNNKTGKAVFETFNSKFADKIRLKSKTHTVVGIFDWLVSLNENTNERDNDKIGGNKKRNQLTLEMVFKKLGHKVIIK